MRSWLLVGAAVLASGCVHPPEEPDFPASPEFDLPPPSVDARAVSDEPPPAPRLRHPKTLGLSDEPYARGALLGQGAGHGDNQAYGNGTTVIINNNIQQVAPSVVYSGPGVGGAAYGGSTWGSGYGGSTWGGGSRGGSTSRGSSGGTPPVGGDWPRVPSYGPR